MNQFDHAINFIFSVEGYVSNSKYDAGGYTKFGIAQKAHPNVDVKNLTLDGAKAIYRRQYWDACRCDDLNPTLALYLMDFAVNSGVKTAVKGLQKCLNLQVSGKADAPLVVDGKIGDKTIAAANGVPDRLLVAAFHAYRVSFYFGLVKKNSTQNKFLRGWMNRLAKLQMYVNGIPTQKFGLFV